MKGKQERQASRQLSERPCLCGNLALGTTSQEEEPENHGYAPKEPSMAPSRGWHVQIEEDQNVFQSKAGGLQGYSNRIQGKEL